MVATPLKNVWPSAKLVCLVQVPSSHEYKFESSLYPEEIIWVQTLLELQTYIYILSSPFAFAAKLLSVKTVWFELSSSSQEEPEEDVYILPSVEIQNPSPTSLSPFLHPELSPGSTLVQYCKPFYIYILKKNYIYIYN